jgi:glycerol-3-phosphate cytidylyltransferase-like family protein
MVIYEDDNDYFNAILNFITVYVKGSFDLFHIGHLLFL